MKRDKDGFIQFSWLDRFKYRNKTARLKKLKKHFVNITKNKELQELFEKTCEKIADLKFVYCDVIGDGDELDYSLIFEGPMYADYILKIGDNQVAVIKKYRDQEKEISTYNSLEEAL